MDPRKENDQGVCCYATRQGKRVSLPYIPVAVRYALDKVVFGDVTVVEHANQTGRMQIVAPCRVHAARPFPFLPSGSPIPIYHFPRFPFSIFLFFLSRSTKRISRIRGKASLRSTFLDTTGVLLVFSRKTRLESLFFSPLPPFPSLSKKRGSVRGVPPSWPGVRGSWLITNVFY